MEAILQAAASWFNSPRGHLFAGLVFSGAAQMFPAYAVLLNTAAAMLGYGGIVAAAPAAAPAK